MRKAVWILSASLVIVPLLVAACSRAGEQPQQSAAPAAQEGAPAATPAPPASTPVAQAAPPASTPGGQPGTPARPSPAPAARERAAVPAPATRERPPEPATPAKPVVQWREVTVPAGTEIPIELETTIGSDVSNVEDPVRGRVTQAVSVEGMSAIPAGSSVVGSVTSAKKASKFKGHAELSVRFDSLVVAGSDERHDIRTSLVAQETAGTGKKTAMKIGLPAVGGAVIGGLIGGKKGAAIGAAVGGGAGTAAVLTADGKEVSLPRGTPLHVKLVDPLTLRVAMRPQ
jgi:hypothetical protein